MKGRKNELNELQVAAEDFYETILRVHRPVIAVPAVAGECVLGEVRELVEALENGSLHEIEAELADVLISLGSLVGAWPIDWLQAVRDKNAVNDIRKWYPDPDRPGRVTRKK